MIANFFSPLTPFTFTNALSFHLTSFSCFNYISCQGSAETENLAIQLTGSKLTPASKGRATYFDPIQLWDEASGHFTDFTTHFSFVIGAQNQSAYGDGLAYFLASTDSKIPMDKNGCTLGLTNYEQALNSKDDPFVAVEFDIFNNVEWDPPGEHVGIDINSMKSAGFASWLSDIAVREGKRNESWISYNSSSHDLSVVFTGFAKNVTVMQSVSVNVDLSRFLPEWITFGFSAATGSASAIHTIYSWDFSTSLETSPGNRNTFMWLYVVLVIVVLLFFGVIIFILWRTNHLNACVRCRVGLGACLPCLSCLPGVPPLPA